MKQLLAIFCLFYMGEVTGQNTIGLPTIINYPKGIYHAGTQNWEVQQDSRGILYFANNEGLLTFDGTNWRTYPLPNETKIFSVAIGRDQRIYVGSQNEFGYFAPGKNGRLAFTSLTDLIPKSKLDFAEVWDIVPVENQVFFRSNRKIFQYADGRITVYNSIDWNFLGYSNKQLIAHDFKMGLLLFEKDHWVPFTATGAVPLTAKVTSFVSLNKDSSLITTLKHGLYIASNNQVTPFDSPEIQNICSKNVYNATAIDKDAIALATNLGGCFIINHNGSIVQRLSTQDGIQNNNILSLFLDKEGNLWLGLDNGIDFVAYNNPIKHIFPDNHEHSAGYTSLISGNALYLGTSNGLYKAPLNNEKDLSFIKTNFEFIPNSKGQVWNLSEVNGQLLMGHNEGAFVIQNNQALPLDNTSGFWSFQSLENIQPSPIMFAGTYNGINFYNFEKGKFTNKSIHSHFESAQFAIMDNDVIWVLHPYNGLYKVTYNDKKPSFTVYNDKDNILAKNRNYLFKVKNRLVISNNKGIFEYNNKKDVFEPSDFLNKLFQQSRVQYMKEDAKGNLWFVQSKKVGVVDFSGSSPKIVYLPELDNRIMSGNHEFIYPFNEDNVFVAGEEGFYLVDYGKYKKIHDKVSVLIRNVKSAGKSDSTYFDGYFEDKNEDLNRINKNAVAVNYKFNSLHFEYSSPVYNQQSTVEYSYLLEGFDKNWSEWSKKNEKDYTNLSPGTYTFQVKARTHVANTSAVSSYQFIVLTPWYRTFWAYSLYVLLIAIVIYFIYKHQKKKFALQQQRHEEEQQKIQYLHQLEIEKTESEIIRLKNEKLENEIQHKNYELASTAMNMVHKGEILTKIKGEVIRLKKTAGSQQTEEGYRNIIRMLDDNKTKKDWEMFAQHFDKVYSDFLTGLKEHYPNLTAGDAKLCAYLRLNLTCKEISQLTNITVKSVELSRYRLRKKLQLTSDVNLANFLSAFHSDYMNGKKSMSDV